MTERLTAAALARRWGITRQACGHRTKEAGCPHEDDGAKRSYPWPAVNDWWIDRCERRASDAAAPVDFDRAQARKEAANADLAEMKRDQLRGRLVKTERFADALTDAFGRVREKLIALPTRVAPELLALEDEAVAEAIVERYVLEVIDELRRDDVPDDVPSDEEVDA